MTDDLKKLEQCMMQATAPCDAAQDAVDAETDSLRLGWFAFGELLEATGPKSAPQPPWLSLPPARQRASRWPIATACLAATVLIAVVISLLTNDLTPTADLPTSGTNVAGNSGKGHGIVQPNLAEESSTPLGDAELAWDDSLDNRIESAADDILQAQQDQFALASTSIVIQDQLESLKWDIEESPL
jgi:hypothetical protein